MPAHYDDPNYLYTNYWQGRDYEHHSEILAIRKLLANSRFHTAVDIGGGYGRLIPALSSYSRKIILIEPSNKLRSVAKNQHPLKKLTIVPGTAQRTRLPSSSVNLILLVRVMHHIPDPTQVFSELYRILKPNGKIILEFANSYNFKARILSILTGRPILPVPVEKRSLTSIRRQTIPFVNHHPKTILKLLQKSGFRVQNQLSVSNFRSPLLKQLLPLSLLLYLEQKLQSPLGRFFFGPSIFLLLDKQSNP